MVAWKARRTILSKPRTGCRGSAKAEVAQVWADRQLTNAPKMSVTSEPSVARARRVRPSTATTQLAVNHHRRDAADAVLFCPRCQLLAKIGVHLDSERE